MFRAEKSALLALAFVLAPFLSGQDSLRILDPQSLSAAGSGWSVAPNTGQLGMVFPFATVPGEIPIAVPFQLKASHVVETRWVSDPEWDISQSPRPLMVALTQDRAVQGGMTFGYVRPAADYDGFVESETFVLEDGTQFRARDLSSTYNPSGTPLEAPEAFGLAAKTWSQVRTHVSTRLITYDATLADLDFWSATVAGLAPQGFTASTDYKVILDKDRARIYAFLPELGVWAPVLWVDRLKHRVTFQWKLGVTAGATVYSVKTMNNRGLGVQVQWAVPTENPETEQVLLRADFIGFQAPSIQVTGFSGMALNRPTALGGSSFFIDPLPAGPVLRPTLVRAGAPSLLSPPAWLAAGFPVPSQAGFNDPWGDGLQWSFGYDAAHAELTALTDPLAVTTAFSYATHTIHEGTARNQNQVRGVVKAVSTDGQTGVYLTRDWTRTLPVYAYGWTQTQWKTTLTQTFSSGEAATLPTQEFDFAGPAPSDTNYGNGALMEERLSTPGKIWAATAFGLGEGGIDGSLTYTNSVSTIVDGQPQRIVENSPDSLTGVSASQSLLSGGELWQTVTSTLEARPGLLDPGRPTAIVTKRRVNGVLTAAPTQKIAYDPTTGQPEKVWTEAGALQQGQQFTYDAGGRLKSVSSYPAGTPSRSTTYIPGSNGLPQSATTTFSTPNGGVNTITQAWTYDAAGRVRSATDGRGVTTTVEVDARGRVLAQSAEGSPSVSVEYPDERTTSWSSAGLSASERRDGFGRVKDRTRPNGATETPTYDVLGRMVSLREVVGGTSRNRTSIYDPLGRTLQASDYDPATDSPLLSFLADGSSARVTRTFNNVPSTVWTDPLGQTVKTADLWSTVTSTYNALGQPMSITQTADGASQTRSFDYDPLGRLRSRTEPETGTTTFDTIDALGNPTFIVDGVRTRTLVFDGLGRLRHISANNGPGESASWIYDGLLLKSASTVSNAQGITQTYAYNGPGARLSSETTEGFGSQTLQYGYDSQFRLKSLTYPSGRVVGYDYDAWGRVDAVTNNSAPLATVGYDDAKWGSRNLLAFASGATSQWQADFTGASLEKRTITPFGGTAEVNDYLRDFNGNLRKGAGWDPLVHDDAGRLTSATGFGLTQTLLHDGFGNNRSSVTTPSPNPAPSGGLNNFTFTAMPNNKVPTQTSTPTVTSTGWDYWSNGEAKSFGAHTGDAAPTVSLGWDGLGRLASATRVVENGTATWTNTYAPSGLRVQLLDSLTPAHNRRYAYTSGGLLLGEYAPGTGGRISSKSVRVFHATSGAGALSKYLGAFQTGDVVNVSLWCKAPTGVSASIALTDGQPYAPDDNKIFAAKAGNGTWQQLTLTWTLTKPATMWLHLYGDMATATSATATPLTSVQYDDVQVTSIGRALVLTEGFEGGLNLGTDPHGTAWTSCGQTQELVTSGTIPDAWQRDVIYLGGEAIAEIDAAGVHELHNDHLGSPRVITAGSTGAVEGRQVFGPYGEKLSSVTSGYEPITGYTGHLQQDPSGLIYMRGRFFTPAWHRFINSDQGVDPMSWNQMAYVGGSPFQWTDPSGMMKQGEGGYTCVNGKLYKDGIDQEKECSLDSGGNILFPSGGTNTPPIDSNSGSIPMTDMQAFLMGWNATPKLSTYERILQGGSPSFSVKIKVPSKQLKPKDTRFNDCVLDAIARAGLGAMAGTNPISSVPYAVFDLSSGGIQPFSYGSGTSTFLAGGDPNWQSYVGFDGDMANAMKQAASFAQKNGTIVSKGVLKAIPGIAMGTAFVEFGFDLRDCYEKFGK